MKTEEMINTMKDAQHEIRALRQRNEILSAKVEVFDSVMCLLHTTPAQRTQGMSPDVVFALEKHIDKLERQLEEDRAPKAATYDPLDTTGVVYKK